MASADRKHTGKPNPPTKTPATPSAPSSAPPPLPLNIGFAVVASAAADNLGGKKERQTPKYGSKYEKARLLGEWATQVSLGAPPCIDLSKIPEKDRAKYTDPLAIAQKAFEDKTMPLVIRRYLPDGSHEDWSLHELTFD